MVTKKYFLNEINPIFKDSKAYFTYYRYEFPLHVMDTEIKTRPALVIIPGGAYVFVSKGEGEPVATRFLVEGFNVFVINYTCNTKYPTPHLEVAAFIEHINKNHEEFKIYPHKISILGFSAGGHLAASYSYLYPELAKQLSVNKEDIAPKVTVLAYPVTLTNEHSHQYTKKIITNDEEELIKKLNVPPHVTKDYPPTFIFTTKEDTDVPPINTYKMIEALEKNNVVYQSIIYEKGLHGGSLYTRFVYDKGNLEDVKENQNWPIEAGNFIYENL